MDGPSTDQLTLPLRHGGLGLAHTGPEEGDAAYLSAVATTQLAMRHGPREFRPFNDPSGAKLDHSEKACMTRRMCLPYL
jgi:hypothetical protein